MDPKQALIDLDQAVSDMDLSAAIMAALAYSEWRIKGGFEPRHMDSMRGQIHGDAIYSRLMVLLADRVEG